LFGWVGETGEGRELRRVGYILLTTLLQVDLGSHQLSTSNFSHQQDPIKDTSHPLLADQADTKATCEEGELRGILWEGSSRCSVWEEFHGRGVQQLQQPLRLEYRSDGYNCSCYMSRSVPRVYRDSTNLIVRLPSVSTLSIIFFAICTVE
jgi:hypothetical protein